MFKKIEPLNKAKHQDLRFTANQGFHFAKAVTSAPLSGSEFLKASRFYPIVFHKEKSLPLIFLSLRENHNNYVNADGTWKVPYIPAHFKRYPFILAKGENKAAESAEDRFVVCIDRDAPHFQGTMGEPMFTADGELAEMTAKVVDFLQKYQQELSETERMFQELEAKGILVEQQFNFEKDGQRKSYGGFRLVDVEKMKKLDDETLAKWVRNGVIALINAHVQSLANVRLITE